MIEEEVISGLAKDRIYTEQRKFSSTTATQPAKFSTKYRRGKMFNTYFYSRYEKGSRKINCFPILESLKRILKV